MQQPLVSPDGRWWWDGRSWRPVPPAGGKPGMFWFFSDPGWAGPYFLTALIVMLPVVGQMVLYGWYLAARDNLRAGWPVLPPAGFRYLERGVKPWVAGLVYGLYLLPAYAVEAAGIAIAVAKQSAAAVVVVAAVSLLLLAASVVLGFLTGALFDTADAQGIGAAIDPRRLWAVATAQASASWRIYLSLLLGGLALFVAAVVTLPILIWIPFGALLLDLAVPAIFLMAVPAQADFNRP